VRSIVLQDRVEDAWQVGEESVRGVLVGQFRDEHVQRDAPEYVFGDWVAVGLSQRQFALSTCNGYSVNLA
jgi:hypothetical protein